MRNPWGTTGYNSDYDKTSAIWTTDNIAKVPLGINPVNDHNLGYFVTPISKIINNACFYDYYIAHDRAGEGYKDARYDYDNVDEAFHSFYITVPAKSGDLYFSVESYPMNSVPPTCTTGTYSYTTSSGSQ